MEIRNLLAAPHYNINFKVILAYYNHTKGSHFTNSELTLRYSQFEKVGVKNILMGNCRGFQNRLTVANRYFIYIGVGKQTVN